MTLNIRYINGYNNFDNIVRTESRIPIGPDNARTIKYWNPVTRINTFLYWNNTQQRRSVTKWTVLCYPIQIYFLCALCIDYCHSIWLFLIIVVNELMFFRCSIPSVMTTFCIPITHPFRFACFDARRKQQATVATLCLCEHNRTALFNMLMLGERQ